MLLIFSLFGCSKDIPESVPEQRTTESKVEKTQSPLITVGQYQNNAVYLAKSYVTGSAYRGTNLDTMLFKMQYEWGINEIYVNVGLANLVFMTRDLKPTPRSLKIGADGECTGWATIAHPFNLKETVFAGFSVDKTRNSGL